MKMTTCLLALFLTAPTLCWALFCPTNFNQINLGDTLKQVETQCGKADTEKTSTSDDNVPQEWVYYFQPSPTSAATLRATLAFDQNKLINLTVNNTSITTTSICGPTNIQIGNSLKEVKAACGKPVMINKAQQPADNSSQTTTTIWTYKGPPAVVLTFENGKLVTRN